MTRRDWVRTGLALGLALAGACATLEERTARSIEYTAAAFQAGDGDAVELSVRFPPLIHSGTVTFLQRSQPLYARPDLDGPVYTTFLAVPYGTPPGEYPVRCRFEMKGARTPVEETLPFQVLPGPVPPPEDRVSARGFNAAAYARDLRRISEKLSHPGYLPARVPSFLLPQGGAIRHRFGTERVYNGRDRVRLDGIEIEPLSARTDEVLAAAEGQVLLAESLPMLGNTVVLDHGFSCATLYAHLRTLEVRPGQTLERGRRLGRTGSTGAAAPGVRLRYQLFVAGVPIDVEKFSTLRLYR